MTRWYFKWWCVQLIKVIQTSPVYALFVGFIYYNAVHYSCNGVNELLETFWNLDGPYKHWYWAIIVCKIIIFIHYKRKLLAVFFVVIAVKVGYIQVRDLPNWSSINDVIYYHSLHHIKINTVRIRNEIKLLHKYYVETYIQSKHKWWRTYMSYLFEVVTM